MNKKQYSKFHKEKTGYSLKEEEITGEFVELTSERKEQLLKEIREWNAKYLTTKAQKVTA